MRALPVMWAVHGYAFRFLAPARSGDGALLNSDMGGSDPFPNEMIELLTQRAKCEIMIFLLGDCGFGTLE